MAAGPRESERVPPSCPFPPPGQPVEAVYCQTIPLRGSLLLRLKGKSPNMDHPKVTPAEALHGRWPSQVALQERCPRPLIAMRPLSPARHMMCSLAASLKVSHSEGCIFIHTGASLILAGCRPQRSPPRYPGTMPAAPSAHGAGATCLCCQPALLAPLHRCFADSAGQLCTPRTALSVWACMCRPRLSCWWAWISARGPPHQAPCGKTETGGAICGLSATKKEVVAALLAERLL